MSADMILCIGIAVLFALILAYILIKLNEVRK